MRVLLGFILERQKLLSISNGILFITNDRTDNDKVSNSCFCYIANNECTTLSRPDSVACLY